VDLSSHRMFLLGFPTTGDVQTLDREINKIIRNSVPFEKRIALWRIKSPPYRMRTKKLRTELLFRLENLQSEIRNPLYGVEEYKDYLTRPSKEIGR